jgi:enoyl-CoA hydratase/carnithine racemase
VALYCDLRFASNNARFAMPLARRGLGAEHGISWLLPRMIGLPNALDLLLSGRSIDANEALRLGLVNGVLSQDSLATSVLDYAAQLITLVSPRSLRVIKKQVWEAQFQTLAQATIAGDAEMISSMESANFKEGILHFLEKRKPSFSGK